MSSEIIEILSEESDSDRLSDDPYEPTTLFNKRRRLQCTGAGRPPPVVPLTQKERKGSSVAAILEQRPAPAVTRSQWNCIEPIYVALTQGFVPTWDQMLPSHRTELQRPIGPLSFKAFRLSLLSLSEFTITGLPTEYDRHPTSVSGLRSHIKQISRSHGKATWERTPEGTGGRWRIPLGAYHALYAFLESDPTTNVDGIPEIQLKIASLGRARLEKGYPSAEKLASQGVPSTLANALAAFQRGGVEFVIEKCGRALIADEMGLGKTVQAIAAMTVYEKEWPLLVLCPSGARYHWESEFQHWLCERRCTNLQTGQCPASGIPMPCFDSPIADGDLAPRVAVSLLQCSQIAVLGSAKDTVVPSNHTRVVICSYGLAPKLITDDKLRAGQFQCIIVDESHMLKNKATKRTSSLLPILKAANRVVLLSGTPAFARPTELWPQLAVLGTERLGWWQDEALFFEKYVKGANASRRAELHTMLTGTVMIRRMKADILKSLPRKIRERATVRVSDLAMRKKFQKCIEMLREGNGCLGDIARSHVPEDDLGDTYTSVAKQTTGETRDNSQHVVHSNMSRREVSAAARTSYSQTLDHIYSRGMERFGCFSTNRAAGSYLKGFEFLVDQKVKGLRDELEEAYRECMHKWMNSSTDGVMERDSALSGRSSFEEDSVETSFYTRKTVLNHMYSLTGKVKVSVIVEMLKRWLDDPAKGKLCIFAHHVFVLDAIVEGAGLQNADGKRGKYIRVDGSTTPRSRQKQIDTFQSDPSVRIALLGITAAGVAVTLTAASTVWFAELFWTPALMIQAEDRCHRIGQQATVRCLYIVARGTLDEFLWKLIEKKFQDLGEFVEGKERLKMTMHRTHDGEKELFSFLGGADIRADAAGGTFSDDFAHRGLSAISDYDHGIQNDIEELGRTEQLMVCTADPGEDEADVPSKTLSVNHDTNMVGRTANAAICLSDDEESVKRDSFNSHLKRPLLRGSTRFPRLRVYKMLFSGPSYGLEVAAYRGRIIVKGKHPDRTRLLGEHVKPDVGHIIVAVSGHPIPMSTSLDQVLQLMQIAIASPPAEIMFAEDAEFAETFANAFFPKVDPSEELRAETPSPFQA